MTYFPLHQTTCFFIPLVAPCKPLLKKLDEIEKRIIELGDDPYIGTELRYPVLKRQGYKVLILEKNLVFYKIDEENKRVIVYAVVDQRQDYLNIIRGL